MVDVFTKEKRSEVMSKIRSRSKLDGRLFSILDDLGIEYEKYPDVYGSPEARIGETLLFADGCFWHGCPTHFKMPKSNTDFWRRKIEKNRARDGEVNEKLRAMGFDVLRIWEHEIKGNKIPERLDQFI